MALIVEMGLFEYDRILIKNMYEFKCYGASFAKFSGLVEIWLQTINLTLIFSIPQRTLWQPTFVGFIHRTEFR